MPTAAVSILSTLPLTAVTAVATGTTILVVVLVPTGTPVVVVVGKSVTFFSQRTQQIDASCVFFELKAARLCCLGPEFSVTMMTLITMDCWQFLLGFKKDFYEKSAVEA